VKFFISTPPPHSEAWLISLKRVMCCFCWGQFKEFRKSANLLMFRFLGSVPGAVCFYGGGQTKNGSNVLATTNIQKILPSIGIKLVDANNNGGPTPVTTGGINQRSGRIDIGGLG